MIGILSMSYGITAQDTVDTKDLEDIMRKVGKLEGDREKCKQTLQTCNTKLEGMIDKVSSLDLPELILFLFFIL